MIPTNNTCHRIQGRTSPPLAHRAARLRGARHRGQGVDKSGCARFNTHTIRYWACPLDFGAKTRCTPTAGMGILSTSGAAPLARVAPRLRIECTLGIITTTVCMYVNGDGTVKAPGQKLLDPASA